MAGNWHVNPDTGNPGRCKVDWSNPNHRGCPHGLSEGQHFGSAQEAVNSYAQQQDLTDNLGTVTAATEQLNDLKRPEPTKPLPQMPPRMPSKGISQDAARKSFWGRNAKRVGGALVATFVLGTITHIAMGSGNGPVEDADAIAPQGDSSVSQEQSPEHAEQDPLPEPESKSSKNTEDSARDLGNRTGEKLKETGQKLKDQVTPERVEKLKEAGNDAKEFLKGLIDSAGGSGNTTSVEVSDGVQFQGKSLQPSAEEIAQAQATLAELKVTPENEGAYYNRAEQFGRSFQTGVVGRLEHRDIPSGTFNNPAPQARAIAGSFIDPYTGEEVTVVKGSSTDTDVDHIVPLKEVVGSEDPSHPLSQNQRLSIANDFDNLQIVGSSVNRSKGDKDPGEWMPPNAASHLRYAIATINVKAKYGLTVDQAEHDALAQALAARQ